MERGVQEGPFFCADGRPALTVDPRGRWGFSCVTKHDVRVHSLDRQGGGDYLATLKHDVRMHSVHRQQSADQQGMPSSRSCFIRDAVDGQ
jgi:hypothetical protein